MLPRLHIVTDDDVLADPDFADTAGDILEYGRGDVALHLRGHRTPGRLLYQLAERLAADAQVTDAWLIVNDRVDVALVTGATGVQLGARSLAVVDARKLLGAASRIGRSVHGDDEAAAAFAEGADFVLRGTVYASTSHPGRAGEGVTAIRSCVERSGGPVVAIGGVAPGHAAELEAAGAHGVAVLGGVWRVNDARTAANRYLEAVRAAWQKRKVT